MRGLQLLSLCTFVVSFHATVSIHVAANPLANMQRETILSAQVSTGMAHAVGCAVRLYRHTHPHAKHIIVLSFFLSFSQKPRTTVKCIKAFKCLIDCNSVAV
uniref:Putative secreted protein n=1 Tax=Amblyomma tuberculatum TaxID=48802 RepID=A0A6M2E2U2_9ACAR